MKLRDEPPLLRCRAALQRAMRRSSAHLNSGEPRKPKVIVTQKDYEYEEPFSTDPATWRSPEERDR